MESEWERVQRRRKEGKCKGGGFRETVPFQTDIEIELNREYQRNYQLGKPRYDFLTNKNRKG